VGTSLLDPNGKILFRYGGGAYFLALDIDGHSFWSGNPSEGLVRRDIVSGTVLMTIPPPPLLIGAIAVVGEPRAAVAGPADIPAMTPTAVMFLAIAFALAGALRHG